MRLGSKNNNAREKIFASLDVGSAKLSCLIAAYRPDRGKGPSADPLTDLTILGVGYQASQGIKNGFVNNISAAEDAIRRAVAEAEQMAECTISDVVVSAACGRLRSENFSASRDVDGERVESHDLARIMNTAKSYATRKGRILLHLEPLGFCLDGQSGISEPRGMIGDNLSADIHAVTTDKMPLSNLQFAVERADLNVTNLIPAHHASALAVLLPQETKPGVLCLDIGAGATKFSIFAEDRFLYADTLILGGHHITQDIATGLGVSLSEAERLKTLYGSVISAQSDDEHIIPLDQQIENENMRVRATRTHLTHLIRPRVEEILSAVDERVVESGLAEFAGQKMVITGGTSQLAGIDQFAARLLGKSVRIGTPRLVSGMPQRHANRPEFATGLGLLLHQFIPAAPHAIDFQGLSPETDNGYLAKVGNWLKESF